jgi:hypothetical protein
VVRVLNLTTPERARQEVSIQHALVSAGMMTPVSQTMKNGDVVGEIDGHSYRTYSKCCGRATTKSTL